MNLQSVYGIYGIYGICGCVFINGACGVCFSLASGVML